MGLRDLGYPAKKTEGAAGSDIYLISTSFPNGRVIKMNDSSVKAYIIFVINWHQKCGGNINLFLWVFSPLFMHTVLAATSMQAEATVNSFLKHKNNHLR